MFTIHFTVPEFAKTLARSRTPDQVSEPPTAYGRNWADVDAKMRPQLQRAALRVLGHVHDAEDAVQEALLRAWQGADRVRDPGAFAGWIFAIQRNVALSVSQRRKARRMAPLDDRDEIDPRQSQPDHRNSGQRGLSGPHR